MAKIVVENATKRFGTFTALDHVSLSVNEHEFVVLLGPSGCGKTTLLRAIAGLGMVDSGSVTISGRDVTYAPPRERNLSMVFQNYAIFPHMTVFDNIAFGLKMQKKPKEEISERVDKAASLLHIEQMLKRYPSQMSGGQRQRIAVARAIAVDAEVLLMDEPLSNLDALLRLEMRAELKSLLQRLGMTTIYVTHDQIEAMSMGDRIAVMRDGRILQFDHPTRVYDNPVNRFVGGFIGNPPMNFLKGQLDLRDGRLEVALAEWTLRVPTEQQAGLVAYQGRPITLGIRAEAMETLVEAAPDTIGVHVEVVEPLGAQNLLTARLGDNVIKISTHPDFKTRVHDQIWLRFPDNKIRWLDSDTGQSVFIEDEQRVT